MPRLLWVIGSLDYCNGITSYAMNYYNQLVKEGYKIDFAVHYDFDSDYKKKILNDGNNVFYMGNYSIRSMIGLKRRIKKILSSNNYDLIHCHILNVAYFYFSVAKKLKIKVRILHSHATRNSDIWYKNIRNAFLKRMALKYTTNYFACSNLAGEYLFKKNFNIIKNAIDYNKFSYNEKESLCIKNEYSISNGTLVLGFVGRFTNQKNIPFLLSIFNELSKIKFDYFGFIIGDGEKKDTIKNFIDENKLNVKIVDSNNDVYKYYSTFDLLLLPSLFEGLPVTAVEAQVAGCKLICSDTITKEVDFSGNCKFLPINDNKQWVMEILNTNKERDLSKLSNDYDIRVQSLYFSKLIMELLENE